MKSLLYDIVGGLLLAIGFFMLTYLVVAYWKDHFR